MNIFWHEYENERDEFWLNWAVAWDRAAYGAREGLSNR